MSPSSIAVWFIVALDSGTTLQFGLAATKSVPAAALSAMKVS